MGKASKTINAVLNVVLWVVIVLAACFTIVTFATKGETGISNIAGYTPMTVLSDSMKGEFGKGDLIVVEKVPVEELKEGDIISFWTVIQNQRVVNTHRIVQIHKDGFYQFATKGDANDLIDTSMVSEGDVIGRYSFKIPVLGKIMQVLGSSVGFLAVIVLPLLCFFLWQLYKLITLVIEMKKEAVKEVSESTRAEIEEELRRKIEAEHQEKRDSFLKE